jgi:uncharacterized Fe-S cluster-containing radical SAM superfamily protein
MTKGQSIERDQVFKMAGVNYGDSATAQTCGCRLRNDYALGYVLEFCSLHGAARELLDIAENLCRAVDSNGELSRLSDQTLWLVRRRAYAVLRRFRGRRVPS